MPKVELNNIPKLETKMDGVVVNVQDNEGSYNRGYENGYKVGNEDGLETGYKDGYDTGYAEGLEVGSQDGYEWFNDGNTHIWISLPEHRKSPMMGLNVNGTVIIDWGDGSVPDTVSGTSVNTPTWTPFHDYPSGGDYIITLTVNGTMSLGGKYSYQEGSYILRHTLDKSAVNILYSNAVKQVELGNNLQTLRSNAFTYCKKLLKVKINTNIFDGYNEIFSQCYSLNDINIPEGTKYLRSQVLNGCNSLKNITIPESVQSIEANALGDCVSLSSVVIPKNVTTIKGYAFQNCAFVVIDFSSHETIPTLSDVNAFNGVPLDFQIRVPLALVDEWKAATNWSTYADQIVGV